MPLFLLRWGIATRVAGLLAAEALLVGVVPLLMLLAFPWIVGYLGNGHWNAWVGAWLAALAGAVLWRLLSGAGEGPSQAPLRFDFRRYSRADELRRRVEKEMRESIPAAGFVTLAPAQWQNFGCNTARLKESAEGIAIPVGCLGIWSVLDLLCHVGHAAVYRRPNPLLFPVAVRTLDRLAADHYQHAAAGLTNLRARTVETLGRALSHRLTQWRLLADMEADRLVAAVYGGAAVADWIQQSALASASVAACLTGVIEPAAKRGQLLPIAEACKAWHHSMEPHWETGLRKEMRAAEHGERPQGVDPVIVRLGALQKRGGANAPWDPRPAATMFEGLEEIEEAALRNEVAGLPVNLERKGIAEIGRAVVFPHMQEELARNAALFEGQDLAALPDLVGRATEMAGQYREDPQRLLGPQQREEMIPHLLAAFLASGLVERGWTIRYSAEEGMRLGNGGRELNPDEVIGALASGAMTREEYLAIVAGRRLG